MSSTEEAMITSDDWPFLYLPTRGIPVVAVTASAMREERARIEQVGFAGYQPKPIQVMEFLKAVEVVLQTKSAKGES